MGCMFQVLTVLDSGFDDRRAHLAHIIVHVLVFRLVGPSKVEARREDGVGTVGWVRGWSSMGEDVILERVQIEYDQQVLILLAYSVTPGLRRSIMHWRIYV